MNKYYSINNKAILLFTITTLLFFITSCASNKAVDQMVKKENKAGKQGITENKAGKQGITEKQASTKGKESNYKKDPKIAAIQEKYKTSTSKKQLTKKPTYKVFTKTEDTQEVTDEVKEIRGYLNNGQYENVLQKTEQSEENGNYYEMYYRGIAYFSMMKNRLQYSEEERVMHRNQAEKLLSKVGYEAPNDTLRAQGLLWYGVTLDLNSTSLSGKRKAIGAFFQIQRTRLRRTSYYNESLLYTGDTYAKMGWYSQARRFYKMLNRVTQDAVVYDYIEKTFYSPQMASERGMFRLKKHMEGDFSYYQ